MAWSRRGRKDERPDAAAARLDLDEEGSPAGAALDALAALVFSGSVGRGRLLPLLAIFDREVGTIEEDDADFDQLHLARMDWALCEANIPGGSPGDTWAWRAIHGEIEGKQLPPSWDAAARSLCGIFEVFPGEPAWVRDRLSGLMLRLSDSIGPWPKLPPDESAALWELRLVPDGAGGFRMARAPIDYPLELLRVLEHELPRRFASPRWPVVQELRKARLRYFRAGGRTPIARLLRFR